ncbi:C6 transcription factor, putative [Paecilomyces variotii No. 5]|uniref:C6 transcription factor, putative n=1 Tax=Byssochlamys spectabilis (strain No. 5 / NBRC 109023) TaxID=1356009 RepID=V5F9D5_BYSSN|nr:C6 transcription factor, putative [Paecilomyces variotii No. 5]
MSADGRGMEISKLKRMRHAENSQCRNQNQLQSANGSVKPVTIVGNENQNVTGNNPPAQFAGSSKEIALMALIRSSHGGAKFHDADFLDHTADLWRKSRMARDLECALAIRSDESILSTTVDTTDLPAFEMFPRPANRPSTDHVPEQDNEINAAQSPYFERYKALGTMLPMKFPENTSDLVDFYFRTTHCWFPIVERRDVLRIMCEDNPTNGLSIEDEGHRLCLWAIIAYSVSLREDLHSYSRKTDSEHIQIYIRYCLALRDDAYGIGHIQAILIIILLHLGRGRFETARILMAQASGILLAVADEEARRSERYQHVWHGCAYIDNILSKILKRDICLWRTRNIHLPQLDQNGLDEWELWSPTSSQQETGTQRHERRPLRVLSTFNLLTELTGKLSPTYEGALEAGCLEERIKDIQTWYRTLDKHHQLHENSNPPLLNLHLTYNFVLMSLLREGCQFGQRFVSLVEEILNSTYTMLFQYFNLTGASTASGLLICFCFQAQGCLESCAQLLSAQVYSSLRDRYGSILARLNRHQHDRNDLAQPGIPQDSPVYSTTSSMRQNPDKRSGTATSSMDNTRNAGDFIVSPGSVGATVPGSDDHGSSGIPTLDSTSDSYLDSIYDDMLSIFPTGRYDEEANRFAQNLGFLSNDIDGNPFAFPFTQQKL